MTDKKILITKSVRDAAPLTFSERGLLAYMLDNLNPQGQFHQPLQKTADDNGSTRPTVYRLTQGLIQKHAVKVASPAFRGSDGWMVPPVLIPIPRVEQVTKYPVPNGTQNQTVLETGTSTVYKPLDTVHREVSTGTVVKMALAGLSHPRFSPDRFRCTCLPDIWALKLPAPRVLGLRETSSRGCLSL